MDENVRRLYEQLMTSAASDYLHTTGARPEGAYLSLMSSVVYAVAERLAPRDQPVIPSTASSG